MTTEEVIVKLTEHDEEIKSLKHRINDCEEAQDEMTTLIRSVDKLALNMEYMLKEQKKQGERLEDLEQAPLADFKHYKRLAIGCVITGIIGAILGAVFAIILK